MSAFKKIFLTASLVPLLGGPLALPVAAEQEIERNHGQIIIEAIKYNEEAMEALKKSYVLDLNPRDYLAEHAKESLSLLEYAAEQQHEAATLVELKLATKHYWHVVRLLRSISALKFKAVRNGEEEDEDGEEELHALIAEKMKAALEHARKGYIALETVQENNQD